MLATPFVAVLLFASPAASQAAQQPNEDVTFVTIAAKDGQAEVELATLAQKKATTEKARTLASQLRTDHERANAELMEIARRKGINVDTSASSEQRQAASKLQDANGAAFDSAYTDEMVQDHQKAVQLFEDYSHTGKDPDLKAFAEKTLPTLRNHLAMAQAAHGSPASPSSH
jgi:putative membrane protein